MHLLVLPRLLPVIVIAAACVAPFEGDARERAARAVTGFLGEAGEAADVRIAFQQDSTHLLVQLLTVAFRTVPEDALTAQATRIAKTALRSYDHADQLDSITVLYRERIDRGAWWIRHIRSFSAASLRDDPQ